MLIKPFMLSITLLGAGLMAPLDARAYTTSQPGEGVAFITGGIGEEDRTRLRQQRNQYNLYVTNAGSKGAYAGETGLTISDRDGETLLETMAGPLFYVQLPPGEYVVEGERNGQNLQRRITVKQDRPSAIQFTWK